MSMAQPQIPSDGMVCSWTIIWNVVAVAFCGLTVLFGILCKTDGFTSFGCEAQTTW